MRPNVFHGASETPEVRTNEAEALARATRAKGTVAAVIEFLCRTRPRFTLKDVFQSCKVFDVKPMPNNLGRLWAPIEKAMRAGLCRHDKGKIFQSFVAGKMP
jgi:hypothetical protein